MRKNRLIAGLAAIAGAVMSLFAVSSFAQDAGAQAFLQSLYAIYQTSDKALDIGSEPKAARYFVPSLAKLIGQDVAQAAKRNEVGKLDFDLFVGGQDWAPTRIDVKVAAGAAADRAPGTARFTAPGEKQRSVVTLDLVKTAAGWRIADIHWSGQPDSLVAIMNRKD
jgi:Protein of unknown function (DUF3828)